MDRTVYDKGYLGFRMCATFVLKFVFRHCFLWNFGGIVIFGTWLASLERTLHRSRSN